MEYIVSQLMNEYEDLYVKNESRIKDSLERITNALHCKKVWPVPVVQVTSTVLYPRHEIFFSREKNLISQLKNINLTLSHKTDYVPYLDPFEGVTVLAEAFGCKVEVPEDGDPWIKEPIIKNNPDDVYLLKKPSINNDVYRRVFDTLRYFECATGCVIPVGCTDPQGPLDVASLIWDNKSFLEACIMAKKEVMHLMKLVTEAFIEFYSIQYETLKNPAYPVHSFPLVGSNDGISISDDEAVLLSPSLYEELVLPYLNRISSAFGGIYYHCCGDFGHILDKILKIKNLRAINAHISPLEFKPEYIPKVTEAGIGLYLGMSDREIGWENPEWAESEIMDVYDNYYLKSVIKYSKGIGVVLTGYGSYQGYINISKKELEESDSLVDGSGHAIHKSPLINLSIEEKNKNFDEIQNKVKSLIHLYGLDIF
ncbi:MAG: hypothetical protein DRP54_00630 [Spirochaetes bacterium]|nr:MAG: hypothetical protein DRP54_00630 [Spirochaetota bacterium]